MKLVLTERDIDVLRITRAPIQAFTSLDMEPRRIDSQTSTGGKVRTFSAEKQAKDFAKLSKSLSVYTYCISSPATDSNAKFVASYIYARWYEKWEKELRTKGVGKPMWHTLTGAFADELRDNRLRGHRKPCGLILGNVPSNSSNVKLEKLRDLLEIYSDIPRIVVTSGEDPVEFFTSKLEYPLTSALLVNAKKSLRNTQSI